MTVTIDPEMQAILREIQSNPGPDRRAMPIAAAREAFERSHQVWNEPHLPIGAIADLEIAGDGDPLRARLYQPLGEAPFPVIVFAHGGSWTFGSLDSHDGIARQLALHSGCAVLAVDYRRAPEHPFPAPKDDVVRALRFVGNGGLGELGDAGRIAVAGDSAGANLVLAALVSMRSTSENSVSAAALLYGCYAPQFDTESHKRLGDGSYLLTTDALRWAWDNYLGTTISKPDPLAAPLYADLTGLPPLYLSAAGLDPLLDDTLALCRRLAISGVAYRFDFFPGVVHGFLRMTGRLKAARIGMLRVAGFLRDVLHDG